MTVLLNNPTLAPLLRSPRLVFYVQELHDLLATETARRQAFCDDLGEDEKAEFINGEKIVHSPVKLRHSAAVGNLYSLLRVHALARGLGWVGVERS